jgi:hypothetical protein
LRPYVFVARDKRLLAAAASSGFENLIEKLLGSEMAVRSIEPDVKALSPADAEQLFNALRDQVLRQGDFDSQPPGFTGLGIVAKHHQRFQTELLSLVAGVDEKQLREGYRWLRRSVQARHQGGGEDRLDRAAGSKRL